MLQKRGNLLDQVVKASVINTLEPYETSGASERPTSSSIWKMNMAKKSNAVVMVSVGSRPWIQDVTDLAQKYAKRCNADLIIERNYPTVDEFPLPNLPEKPGRPNKRAYALKTYYAWKHLHLSGYDRVLVLDDTCCINTISPDLFELSEKNTVLYTTTGLGDAEKSFADIRRFLDKNGREAIPYEADLYMNSGVLLYEAGMKDAIAPEKVLDAADLLFSAFPHQSLTYFLLRSGKVNQSKIDRRFNKVPAVSLEKQVRRHMVDITEHVDPDVYIYHITGMYYYREILIPQVCDLIHARSGL